MAKSRPNVLVLMSDQQRLDTVGAYGLNDLVKTPHIDGLAQRGVRFDNAFTPTAICSPARACFYTGLYPHHHGVTANGLVLREGVRGINHYLDEAGYRSGYAGKWHVDEQAGPSQLGFLAQDFLGYAFPGSGVLPGLTFGARPKGGNPYVTYLDENGFGRPEVTDRFTGKNSATSGQEMFARHDGPVESCIEHFVAAETIRVMDELAKEDDPFFIWANFWGPHTPCLVPEPYYSMYDPDAIPEHPSYKETFENKPHVQHLIEHMWGLGEYGWRGFQEIAARYLGHCTLIDDMVGLVLTRLDQLGLADDTVVVYTSDHGDCLGAHRLIEKGEFMYDEIYHIPLVIAHPECEQPGSVNDDFVYLHEAGISALDIAGLDVPDEMDGHSLQPAMLGRELPFQRDEVYCLFDRHFTIVNQRMVRTRTHQLTFNSFDKGELYDLVDDPYQLHNRYGDPEYDEVRRDLLDRMDRHMAELEDPVHRWFNRMKAVY